MNKPTVVTLTGPSCAGKTHLERHLADIGYSRTISVTTREPRAGEVDGVDYYFVNKSGFIQLKEEGKMIESVEFNGQFYGITKSEIERLSAFGHPIVIVAEPEGARQFKEYAQCQGWNLLSVFVNNPPEVIAERFLARFAKEVDSDSGADLSVYASRLAIMMTTERLWVNLPSNTYDVWFDRFDGDTEGLVVDFITKHIDAVMKLEEAA